jgi:hypothetical protein
MADWNIELSGAESLANGIDGVAENLEDATYIVGTNVEYAVSRMPSRPAMAG